MGSRLLAIVAQGIGERVYLSPTTSAEALAMSVQPTWKPDVPISSDTRSMFTPLYGLTHFWHLFTSRQLTVLTTLSDLVSEAREHITKCAEIAGWEEDIRGLDNGGMGAKAYAEAVSVYLAFAVSRLTMRSSSQASWDNAYEKIQNAFGRQAIPMVWDYCEGNPFSTASGNFQSVYEAIVEVILNYGIPLIAGTSIQADAQTQSISQNKVVSTDPPYYDNIGYADLSDFFYPLLRRMLRSTFPVLLATIATPKDEELVAAPHRQNGKQEAESFFLDGMTSAMQSIASQAHPQGPITIYYAFKQSDTKTATGTTSTGWETFLEAVNRAGLQLTGTWPMRTEMRGRVVERSGTNALASSIILVCRKRPKNAPTVSRREFVREINAVLPEALDEMTRGSGDHRSPIAPVDLSQAIIGPGMAVFSRYAAVLEADGTTMSVRTALQLINRFLAEDDFDADTQFCLHWFEQYGWEEGRFGMADTLSRAKGTSVDGMREAGVLESGGGIVRLKKWREYPTDWDPKRDARNPVWETLHHLIRALKEDGENGAAAVLSKVKAKAEAARQLAYRLYTLCERQSWAEDARAYNELITSWSGIEAVAGDSSGELQPRLL